jgi:hypothetical protein
MAEPRFSVVIPTRDRADTLRVTLRTCVEQDFDDYEVVVCDNCGGPATREAVEDCGSPRVRCVRPPRLLSMSSNWELAVSEARGEYLILLGDDDALLSHALPELDGLIGRGRPRAVRWTSTYYSWPTIDLPGQGNYLRIPLGREVRAVDAKPAIAAAARFEACYTTLPMLYHNAAVRRDLVEELRARAGRVFGCAIPDVYTAFALAYLAGSFLSLDAPMTVAGTSGGSFGVANLFHRGRRARDHEFRTLNAQEGLPTDPRVPDLPIFPYVPVAESFLLAKAQLFPADDALRLDRRAFASLCVSALRADNEADWRAALGLLRASFDDDPESQAWFDATLAGRPFAPPAPVRLRTGPLGYDGDFLHLEADRFGVEDVYGAARLCEHILNYRADGIRYDLPTRSAQEARARVLQGECDARLQVIQGLKAAADERLALVLRLDAEVKRRTGERPRAAWSCVSRPNPYLREDV